MNSSLWRYIRPKDILVSRASIKLVMIKTLESVFISFMNTSTVLLFKCHFGWQWCWWHRDVNHLKLVSIYGCWWQNFDVSKPSPTFHSCLQHISSPTSVTNIDSCRTVSCSLQPMTCKSDGLVLLNFYFILGWRSFKLAKRVFQLFLV